MFNAVVASGPGGVQTCEGLSSSRILFRRAMWWWRDMHHALTCYPYFTVRFWHSLLKGSPWFGRCPPLLVSWHPLGIWGEGHSLTCPADRCLARCHRKVPFPPCAAGEPPALLPFTAPPPSPPKQTCHPNSTPLQGLWPEEAVGGRAGGKPLSAPSARPAPPPSHRWVPAFPKERQVRRAGA